LKFPILKRLDPRTIFDYVCKDDDDDTPTIFKIKPLTVFEFKSCEEGSPDRENNQQQLGEFTLKILQAGLVGWDNFVYENGEVIPFSFSNIGAIKYDNQVEIFENIMDISDVSEEVANEVKFVTRWSDFVSKSDKQDLWSCDTCIERKLFVARNCNGDMPNRCLNCNIETDNSKCPKCGKITKPHFKFIFPGDNPKNSSITRCPVSMLSSRAVKLTNLINYIESSKSLPFGGGALDQTNYFYTARMIVLSEQSDIMKQELKQKSQQKSPSVTRTRPPSRRIGRR